MYFWLFFVMVLFVLFDELQQECEKNRWPEDWKISKWLNEITSYKNKHNWKPTWLFNSVLVWLTDGPHFFQMLNGVTVIILGILMYFTTLGIIEALAPILIGYYGSRFVLNNLIFDRKK